MTIHRWSGIQDGRYSSKEVVSLIKNNEKFKDALQRIQLTDTLIIDEVSMLSERLFDQLGEICSLRDPSKLFGGIQLILCGDFVQLPPVPNALYNDDGKYCFQSTLFQQTIPHRIYLNEIVRQSEVPLICAIREVSCGEVSDATKQFMNTLQRPLSSDKPSVKLFATNYLVDNYNRKCVVEARGEMGEYCAEDTGQERYLSRLLAPKVLWLKVGSPVILLRNLTNKLCNGLSGTIVSLETDGPVVNFPTVNETMKIPKMTFTVFSPQHQSNLAERFQVPLKLAYALSIHKSQGMTLDSVEVDCQQMFKPGQLGVAMGRVRTTAGLRVINFKEQGCLPQPECINTFVLEPSMPREDSLTCCKVERLDESTIEQLFNIQDMMWIEADPETSELQHVLDGTVEEEEFDDDFNKIIASTVFVNSDEMVDFVLPPGFDVVSVLRSMKTDNVLTPLMKEVNDLVSTLLSSNLQAAQEFSKKEFLALLAILDDLNIAEPVAVKTEHLSDFYRKSHLHQTSDEYKLNCMMLFHDMSQYPDAHGYISFNITTAIRKFLLQEKVDLFPVCDRTTSTRTITSGCRARVRYVGGYCVSKVRYKYIKQRNSTCYQTSIAAQERYEEANSVVQCLDKLRENESFLEKHSDLPETLLDVTRRQNISRGLTHIPDTLYSFFMLLCEKCLSTLTDINVHTYGDQLYNHCLSVLTDTEDSRVLHEQFVKVLVQRTNVDDFSATVEDDIRHATGNVLHEIVLRVHAIDTLFMEILKKFLMVMLNQFRKDLLQALSVEKTMAHRKQILVKKK
ncbi:uncharacterized protein LOC110447633 [Mizuhopecten yessoensis]|uniref:uncharacterized protein LOC110447633 n=1 Tax=Mizuhopecten yessoensis TaxID=6573 RepID=UPI000B45DD77|nr:uncharacterized protein LOC110447633 [Mizuhopecten yessoensis]